jgi:hypothetical protein
MTDRPLARFHEGQLEMDVGGVYYPTGPFNVMMTERMFETRSGPDAARYVRDCRRALAEYDKAMEEAKCEAATH